MFEEDGNMIVESNAMKDCKRQYIGQYNSFSMFAEAYIQPAKGEKLASADMKRAYHQYCLRNDYEELNDNVWGQTLKQQFACSGCTLTDKQSGNERRQRGYKGLSFKSDVKELLSEAPSETTPQTLFRS